MLLQRQYSLWKLLNTFIFSISIFLLIVAFLLNWRTSHLNQDINKEKLNLTKIEKEIQNINNKGILGKFRLAGVIQKKENTINYSALYKFLYMIKEDLSKELTKNHITTNRFLLKVEKDKINISLMVPNFNRISDKSSNLLENITKRSFIKKAEINSYAVKGMNTRFVYFDMSLFTK